uniref:Glutaredoxin domain-containing protein n=1 Tax=Pyramimonas obovata TaxID=1411642 RepID=A0A7S0QRJ5_9CHLO|mmetsp:Transcript_11311/g.23626  ORF Transcript_11311/g.23626 Transcript_11311/m.23626 type:complete len:106 (+) Transcript_11311:92-409(+)
MEATIQTNNTTNPVMVYSKSYCPFCDKTKKLFGSMGVTPKVIELDKIADGDKMQATLAKLTGQRTVPNVFVGGKHLGGNDDTHSKHRTGELTKMLESAGVTTKPE